MTSTQLKLSAIGRWLLWGLAVLLWIAALWLGIGDAVQDDTELLAQVEAELQAGFDAELEAVRKYAKLPHKPNSSQEFFSLFANRGTLVVGYARDTGLRYWNTRDYVPQATQLRRFTAQNPQGLLRDKNRVYYVYTDGNTIPYFGQLFYLIPLRIEFPIDNEFLPDYTFLAGRAEWIDMERVVEATGFTLTPTERSTLVRGPDGTVIYGLRWHNTSPLREPGRKLALGLAGAAFLLTVLIIRAWLRRRFKNASWVEWAMLAGVTGVRAVLWALHFPSGYVGYELFSPALLALDDVNPSLGDLALNSLLLIWLSVLIYRYLPQKRLGEWLAKQPAWVFWLGAGVVVISLGAAFSWFFQYFDKVVLNSQIYFEFADFFRLDLYSYLVFLALAFGLISFFLALYALSGVIQVASSNNRRRVWPLLVPIFLVALTWWLWDAWIDKWQFDWPVQPMVFILTMVIVYILRQYVGAGLRFGLLPALALFTLFAGVTNLAVSISLEHATQQNLESVAQRFGEDKNLITESTFDSVIENIRQDSTIWHTDTLGPMMENPFSYVIPQLLNKHLMTSFKQYDIRVFVFSGRRRLDNQFDVSPYPLTDQLMVQGRTLSSNLFFVPYRRSVTQNIYVGRAPISSAIYGRIILQVELHPKNFLAGKLYPQLLLDRSIRKKLLLPPDYGLAIYVNGQLSRKEGTGNFPLRYNQNEVGNHPSFTHDDSYYWYVKRLNAGKIIVARAPRRSSFDKLTAFSFLFYFFVVLYLLLHLPSVLPFIRKPDIRFRHLNFATRIQLYLVVLTLLPLIAIWAFTTPLFERFYYEETQGQLRSNLVQVASYLENESSFSMGMRQLRKNADPTSVDLVTNISDILFADINIYDARGHLYVTTRPKIFQMALASSYINPEALEQLRRGEGTSLIVDETLGGLSYFSGYSPILDAAGNVLGYINIPFLSRQDVLRDQIRNFIAYLINVYVVLILVLVLASLLISKSITNPLRLLKQRLDETQVGHRPEPLAWNSEDEIGAIIESYNRMLAKLEESEKRLARSEREGAWREMARQVAHEIKNPLTPMKLSIQHLVRALQQSEDEKTQNVAQKVSKTLLAQIDSLTAIANSFSQFATIAHTERKEFSLNGLIVDVYNLYASTGEAVMVLDVPDNEVVLNADPNQLNRVFVNLVRNAIQAGATHIELGLKVTDKEAIATVTDNGGGIPLDIQDRIFEPNFSTKTSGMGLGLAICRRIVETMYGEIRFESTPDQGTTFYLTFPLNVVAEG